MALSSILYRHHIEGKMTEAMAMLEAETAKKQLEEREKKSHTNSFSPYVTTPFSPYITTPFSHKSTEDEMGEREKSLTNLFPPYVTTPFSPYGTLPFPIGAAGRGGVETRRGGTPHRTPPWGSYAAPPPCAGAPTPTPTPTPTPYPTILLFFTSTPPQSPPRPPPPPTPSRPRGRRRTPRSRWRSRHSPPWRCFFFHPTHFPYMP